VLRRTDAPQRERVARGWRILHNKEIHKLYISPNITRVIISRRMGWAGQVARMEEMITA
jgi:hypothetical protein